MQYHHRQTSFWPLLVFVPVTLALSVLSLSDATDRAAMAVSVGMAVLIAAFFITWFSTLTVTVTEQEVTAYFLLRRPKRVILRADIARAERVRLGWSYGSGVRWNTPWGLPSPTGTATYLAVPGDGVAFTLKNGQRVQIGTDDPEGLLRALAAAAA